MSSTSQASHRGLVAGIAVAAMALALLVAPAAPADSAEDGSGERVERLRSARAGDGAGVQRQQTSRQQQEAGAKCFDDTANDVVDDDTDQATTRAEAPRADIRRHCAAYGENLVLQVQVAEPTNPRTDNSWNNATFVGWFLDTDGDNNGDFFASYHLDAAGELIAEVQDVRTEESAPTCASVGAAYDGETYSAGPIEPACIDNAETVTVAAGMFYDVDGAQGPLLRDTAPDEGAFTPEQQRTDACEDPLPAPFADRGEIALVHRPNVDCLYARGVTLGTNVGGERRFLPRAAINRGQFSAFTFRALGVADIALPGPQRPRFDDVAEGHTFDEEIHRLAAADILLGETPSRFNPNGFIYRDQSASVLLRAVEHARGQDIAPQNPGAYFRDTDRNYHRTNIDAAYEQNLVQGVVAPTAEERGLYRPRALTTRQQMASVINRFIDTMQGQR